MVDNKKGNVDKLMDICFFLDTTIKGELVELANESKSIEEWEDDVHNAYIGGTRRPDSIILVLDRYGECYKGALYVAGGGYKNE